MKCMYAFAGLLGSPVGKRGGGRRGEHLHAGEGGPIGPEARELTCGEERGAPW